jgi:hypothetical protein
MLHTRDMARISEEIVNRRRDTSTTTTGTLKSAADVMAAEVRKALAREVAPLKAKIAALEEEITELKKERKEPTITEQIAREIRELGLPW